MNENQELTGFEIAVIGMAGRFPGAKNINQFWDNLNSGVESITFFSDEDLKGSGVSQEVIDNPNFVKAKGILEGIDFFDAHFFGYMPREAEIMDPQMRIFHECVWETLEDAGYDPMTYPGLIGLYAGATPNHYWEGLAKFSGKAAAIGRWEAMHYVDKDYLCLRISYKLNLMGPSFAMYTACSTSLVAVHLGCQALLNGECDMALAGGVTVSLPEKSGYLYKEGMVQSRDGHVRTFDAQSNGIVIGNGAGLVMLKRYEDALEDRDHIYALIKGTAINNDGVRKSAFTAPSVEGQTEVIKLAQQVAHVEPESISYIEAHGTGTELGDPIEMEALKLAFNTHKKKFCGIGSVKTNVGHTDSAAGITSLIKTALALKYKLIPPTLHYESPNPGIDFENSPFYVVSKPTPWKNSGYPLRAGVSALGIGGTNAHVILEEAPVILPPEIDGTEFYREYNLVLLSAKTPTALEEATGNLVRYLQEQKEKSEKNAISDSEFGDGLYTLQVGRGRFPYRRITVCKNIDEAIDSLSAPNSIGIRSFFCKENSSSVVFMFAGQGAQYVNMGRELYRKEPFFKKVLDQCFHILSSVNGTSLIDILYPEGDSLEAEEKMKELAFSFPIKFAFEYSLAKLLMHWGIEPYAMIGHSFGEYLAACLAGVFSLEDALELVAYRGKLMSEIDEGAMTSVPLPEAEIKPYLDEHLSLAAVNGRDLCIVSGTKDSVAAFEKQLEERELECVRLRVNRAGHSNIMDPILKRFQEKVASMSLAPPQIPYISNLSGKWITKEEAIDPGYWAKHIRHTVRFYDGISLLLEKENTIFIEIGSGQSLKTYLKGHPGKKPGHRVLNLIKHYKDDISDSSYLVDKIGQLWLYGQKIDWNHFHEEKRYRRLPLPTYPFQRRRFWIDWSASVSVDPLLPAKSLSKEDPYQESRKAEELAAMYDRPEISTPFQAPRTDMEEELVAMWKSFFGIKTVGIHDDFFELGGDSLKALNIIGKIHKKLNIEIPVTEFFNRPSIEELAGFMEEFSQETSFTLVEAVEKRDHYLLSSAQKRLYLFQQLEPESIAYNTWETLEIKEEPDIDLFEQIFSKLLVRHESLRTCFITEKEEPVQIILNKIDFKINVVEAANSQVSSIIKGLVVPFDLSKAPLLRVSLVKTPENSCVLVLDMHHIISDAVSMRNLIQDFSALFSGKELSPLRIQYKDYVLWQNALFTSADSRLRKQEEYWLNQLAGPVPLLKLPTDFARPAKQSFEGNRIRFSLKKERLQDLRAIALKEGVTLHILMMSILYILMAKLCNQDEIFIGTPIAGRRHPDLDPLIGVFINTLVQRNMPLPQKSFLEFLGEVKKNSLEAYDNQDYPFDELVKKLWKGRESGRNPFFDLMFEMRKMDMIFHKNPEQEIKDLNIRFYKKEVSATLIDLDWLGLEMEDSISFTITYAVKLFQEETVQFFADSYLNLVDCIIKNKESKINDLHYGPFNEIGSKKKENDVEFNF